nr:MAG TPA: hypothetical protein [Caudoviricetes sp.]
MLGPLNYFVNEDKVDHITREARIVKVRSFWYLE